MNSSNRLVGGILLVAGTAVGAGMLALPVISAFAGFFPSLFALILCWGFFYATAILFLDVSLQFSGNANMITMAEKTLGPIGKAACWVVYLMLLYALTAAYIAGSAPLFLQAMDSLGFTVPSWFGPLPLLVIFGLFVYFGTRVVDTVNRILIIGLIIAYAAIVVSLPEHIDFSFLTRSDFPSLNIAISVFFTSFGFHIIIPTLTTYLHRDEKKLRLAILAGSLIPLGVYAIWEFLVMGVVPFEGNNSLFSAWSAGDPGTVPLAAVLHNPRIHLIANAFSLFAILTSFLGVSLSLSEFLGDGLKVHRFTWGREIACLLTYLPPLLFVLSYQRGFLLALQYAGIFVAILLGIFPALMAWKLPKYRSSYHRIGLSLIVFISLLVIALDIVGS